MIFLAERQSHLSSALIFMCVYVCVCSFSFSLFMLYVGRGGGGEEVKTLFP